MKKNNFAFSLTLLIVAFGFNSFGQVTDYNQLLSGRRVITTAVPFLIITPDTRSGGMGDVGVAISPDANTIHWNPAKLAFMEHDGGMSISYTPWLRSLVPDISLSYISGYYKIDKLSGFGGSLRYFSLGDIQFTDNFGNDIKTYRPYEFATDLAYARKLSDYFSIGVAGRFIYSDLAGKTPIGNGSTTKPAVGFGGDFSGYYARPIKIQDKKADLGLGFNISNIGPKVTYTNETQRDFIPINMRLGSYLNYHIDEFNEIAIALDFNKLLVPTNPVYALDSLGNIKRNPQGQPVIEHGRDPKQPVIQGMLQSFYDAPGGFREELREYNPSIGIEYWYDKQFAGRAGYFYEHPTKGSRQYATVGLAVRYNVFTIDFSYLFATNGQKTTTRNPLDNTLRFSLQFNFDGKKGSLKKFAPGLTPIAE
ncbi:MAG: type IX secretion system outer membrane channel protein PorV [Bacteroidetes bacterium]|nr:type IX secretion system outer membrane channel protein PorV [Bacteroidota bacterium]